MKKEFIARPWVSDTGVLEEVEESIIKQNRPLIKMRVSMPRKQFADTNLSIVDKESGDMQGATQDIKPPMKGTAYMASNMRKVLDIGLQSAHQIKRVQTQTYFGRMVNKAVMYDPKDFMDDSNAQKKKTKIKPWETVTEEEEKKINEEAKKAAE